MGSPRLLEDVARTFAEHGATSSSTAATSRKMARNWYVIEIGDVRTLRAVLSGLRQIESVFDAYRVTPGALTAETRRRVSGSRR